MEISKEDQQRITKAIHAAEAKSSGEIVCVLAQTSTQAAASPIFVAAVIALVLPWLLTAFTSMAVVRILSLQVIAFLVLVM
jgi:putative membrane protein